MTVRIELDEETAEKLKAWADRRGKSLETYIRELAEAVPPPPKRMSNEEFVRRLDEVSAELDDAPPLPADFSRDDLYSDHD